MARQLTSDPRLVSRVDAILSAEGFDAYHEFRLMRYDLTVDDLVEDRGVFLRRGEEIPTVIEYAGRTYTQGQWSGVKGSVIWFDCEDDV